MTSPSEAGAQSDSARTLIRGANDSIDCSFAFIRWRSSKHSGIQVSEVPYLAIIQDKTEASCDGLEGTKGIRRFIDPTKD